MCLPPKVELLLQQDKPSIKKRVSFDITITQAQEPVKEQVKEPVKKTIKEEKGLEINPFTQCFVLNEYKSNISKLAYELNEVKKELSDVVAREQLLSNQIALLYKLNSSLHEDNKKLEDTLSSEQLLNNRLLNQQRLLLYEDKCHVNQISRKQSFITFDKNQLQTVV